MCMYVCVCVYTCVRLYMCVHRCVYVCDDMFFIRLYSSAVFQHQFDDFSPPELTRRPVDDLFLQMKVTRTLYNDYHTDCIHMTYTVCLKSQQSLTC